MGAKTGAIPAANDAPSYLPVAVRAYAETVAIAEGEKLARRRQSRTSSSRWPEAVLIFDTETTTDATQRLTFGCYRYCVWTQDGRLVCVEEGIIHADDLPERDPAGFATLKEYARSHWGECVAPGHSAIMPVYSRSEFMAQVFWKRACKDRALVVGFNLPFDLSRIAVDWGQARGRFMGGFSFVLAQYRDNETGAWRENGYRPRVGIKHMDSKRALKGFTGARDADAIDRIPEGAPDGKPDKTYSFRGHFLDLRTLIFALTDRGHSLDSACRAFGVEHGKEEVETHGVITPAYIGYNRRDVLATQELLEKVRAEYDRHPIALQPTKAYSPASVAKAYLRAMGVRPIMARQPDFPRAVLGYAMAAYYGGRAEVRIRHTPVPVVYTDFLSMYPTVNVNMGLWRFIVAARIDVVDATDEVQGGLDTITLDNCFDPETWRDFTFFAAIAPNGDIVPVRAGYSGAPGEYNIGVNPLYPDAANTPMWYAGPDLVAAKLLTGKIPKVVRAFRLVPVDTQAGLKPVALRSDVAINPAADDFDFFRTVIEARKGLKNRDDLNNDERERLDRFLKVLANSGSYGIYAEMNRRELPKGEKESINVYGVDDTPFTITTTTPEDPGAFCFPPLAALITAAARLMLALLERCITDAGGSYAFCDTDSMAMVATEHGGLIACEGGAERLPDGTLAIRVLSWGAVEAIVTRFDNLKPYDPQAVPGHVLEVEKENMDKETGEQRQLWCYGISAKRYALYNLKDDGAPHLRKYSEHGLGHLLDPAREPGYRDAAPEADNTADEESALVSLGNTHDGRGWMRTLWEGIVNEAHELLYQWPNWLSRPALTRLTTSSPALMHAFEKMNAGKLYADQVKPFNFILTAHRQRDFIAANGSDRHGLLIAPFETDARKWTRIRWTDRETGKQYRITTGDDGMASDMQVQVQSYSNVLTAYRVHPEPKSGVPEGQRNAKLARGLLPRRPVRALSLAYIGKESNKLEEVEAGMHDAWDEVQNEYHDPRHDPWLSLVIPVLKEMPKRVLMETTGISKSEIERLRNGHTSPIPQTRAILTRAAATFARNRLAKPAPRDDLAILAAYRDAGEARGIPVRDCPGCQRSFNPAVLRQRYCTPQCRERTKKRTSRARIHVPFVEP